MRAYSNSPDIPVYGFGGKYNGRDYDIFQCGSHATVNGVTELLQAYDNVFSTGIIFGDRCKYDSVIMAAANQAQKQWVRFLMKDFSMPSKLLRIIFVTNPL
jgi:Copine